MEAMQVAVLGIGGLTFGPGIVGSLATYFGERPLSVRLYDADEERLDFMHRFLRTCCIFNQNDVEIFMTLSASEALMDATHIILSIEPNCAMKILRVQASEERDAYLISSAIDVLASETPLIAPVLSLLPPDVRIPVPQYYRLPEPLPMMEGDAPTWPHQILRWINADEYPIEFLKEHAKSPLKSWLDDIESALLVSEA
ncbi:MAG: hypothetical protein KF784_01130 [Fimbriimonadaceae bacterium]|nr:hypothetical protein [Fimbriimonadaceae bacterium]